MYLPPDTQALISVPKYSHCFHHRISRHVFFFFCFFSFFHSHLNVVVILGAGGRRSAYKLLVKHTILKIKPINTLCMESQEDETTGVGPRASAQRGLVL